MRSHKMVKRVKRVKRSSNRTYKRIKRTRRSFKNKRKTQKKKRVLRGGADEGTPEEVPESLKRESWKKPGVVYTGKRNELLYKLRQNTSRIIRRDLETDSGMEDEDLARALMGAIVHTQNIEKEAVDFSTTKKSQTNALPPISMELFDEFMEKKFPDDASNMSSASVVEKDDGALYKYTFESVYNSMLDDPNFEPNIVYDTTNLEWMDEILQTQGGTQKVFQDLLENYGSILELNVLKFLGEKFFPTCDIESTKYTELKRGILQFLDKIKNNSHIIEFIESTIEKYKQINDPPPPPPTMPSAATRMLPRCLRPEGGGVAGGQPQAGHKRGVNLYSWCFRTVGFLETLLKETLLKQQQKEIRLKQLKAFLTKYFFDNPNFPNPSKNLDKKAEEYFKEYEKLLRTPPYSGKSLE